jgi:hypothetical protein
MTGVADLHRALRRLPDAAFEKLIRLERQRRQKSAGAFRKDSSRHSYRRGLSKGDQVSVTRRYTYRWDQ